MTRRILEAATRALPAMVLLFVPILFGLQTLFPWAREDLVRADPHLSHQRPYLNVEFFLVRAVVYFASWLGCAWLLNRWSAREDRRRALSGGGLVLYALTVYFASVDWGMSTEPRWSSTIYGLLFMASHGLGAIAFITLGVVLLSGERPLRGIVTGPRLLDLGNLLLASLMLWAYISFSQYLIIWSGNLPREISWYASRTTSSWKALALALVILHFAVPFFLLLFRGVKTRGPWIAGIALGLLTLRLVDDFWRIVPAFEPGGLAVHWTYLTIPVGIGGVWVASVVGALRRQPLLPLQDPIFESVIAEARSHES